MFNSIYNFEKVYKEGVIKSYEKDLVAEGICKSFIPASFIRERDGLKVIYSFDGFMMVSEMPMDEKAAMHILSELIEKMELAADLFIDLNRIYFDPGTLFYDEKNDELRMAFLIDSEELTFKDRFMSLAEQLSGKTAETGSGLLQEFISYISEMNPDMNHIRIQLREYERKLNV